MESGLNDVNYSISSKDRLIINGFPVYLFNINIRCIFEKTPWCRPNCTKDDQSMPKTMWEWNENDLINPQIKSKMDKLKRNYEFLNEIRIRESPLKKIQKKSSFRSNWKISP